jgi:hypothetical protein
VARRRSRTEWPDGEARDTQWASRADGHPDGCPTEGGRAPDGGRTGARRRPGVARRRARCVPDGGRGLVGWPNGGSRGGPTEDYIRAGGPPFWALSSCAQSHLQEMRECRVLMSESAGIPKGMSESSVYWYFRNGASFNLYCNFRSTGIFRLGKIHGYRR